MAARGSKAGPNRKGHNSEKSDDSIIKKAAESFKDIRARRAAFNAKMSLRHEKEVSGPMKAIGIKMKHAEFYFDNHVLETGTDEDAVQKATNDRALMLVAGKRIHAALHDGEQLDWDKLQKQADKAVAEAEEEAGSATEKVDGE